MQSMGFALRRKKLRRSRRILVDAAGSARYSSPAVVIRPSSYRTDQQRADSPFVLNKRSDPANIIPTNKTDQ